MGQSDETSTYIIRTASHQLLPINIVELVTVTGLSVQNPPLAHRLLKTKPIIQGPIIPLVVGHVRSAPASPVSGRCVMIVTWFDQHNPSTSCHVQPGIGPGGQTSCSHQVADFSIRTEDLGMVVDSQHQSHDRGWPSELVSPTLKKCPRPTRNFSDGTWPTSFRSWSILQKVSDNTEDQRQVIDN